jgi:hypothetical protein
VLVHSLQFDRDHSSRHEEYSTRECNCLFYFFGGVEV